MKKSLLLPFLLLAISGVCNAQTSKTKESLTKRPEKEQTEYVEFSRQKPKTSQGESRDLKAKQQIQRLKGGILLVRLRTQENVIKQLQKTNKTKANVIKVTQDSANFRLARAFRKNFDFCPVYFFYSSDSEKILKGKASGIFLNKNLKPAPEIQLPEKPFFIAEITDIEQSEADPNNPQVKSNTGIAFRALVLRDSSFTQLVSPFPFYVKIQQLMPPRQRTEEELVKILNANLKQFNKTAGYKAK